MMELRRRCTSCALEKKSSDLEMLGMRDTCVCIPRAAIKKIHDGSKPNTAVR